MDAVSATQAVVLAVTGLAVFVAPGALLLGSARIPLRHDETLAFSFAASLALLTATFAACLLLGTAITVAPSLLAATTAAASAAALVLSRSRPSTSGEAEDSTPSPALRRPAPRLAVFLLVVLTLAFALAAVAFAPVGSVDRWWYLAYVRGYLDASVLSLHEPFLGTGESFARFGLHPWLFGLALWSWLSGIDPVRVYEQAAPVLVVLVSVCATLAMARGLFGQGPATRFCVLASMLLWSGGLIPLLARAGEDKILAAAALFPLCIAGFLRAVGRGEERDEADAAPPFPALTLLFLSAVATAAVHALAYALVLVALLPTVLVVAIALPLRRRRAGLACVVLLAVSVAPAASGLVVRQHLGAIGAQASERDHPVVRVHEGRQRFVALPAGATVVHPRLLFHPLSLLGLAGFLVVLGSLRRIRVSSTQAGQGGQARQGAFPLASGLSAPAVALVATTTAVALALAFVPPLPTLAGYVIPPWMVYRVLWVLPLGALAAEAMCRFSQRTGSREEVAWLLILALGLPGLLDGTQGRLRQARERLALPSDPALTGLVQAIAALPEPALIVAAPQLAERIPALTSRPVIAGLDRSTIVFSGSRERGEARLRARAALLLGDPDGSALARLAGLTPTHAVFDPRSNSRPDCSAELYRRQNYSLCRLAPGSVDPARIERLAPAEESVAAREVSGACSESIIRRAPWDARPTVARCLVKLPEAWRRADGLGLVIESDTGRASDELLLSTQARGQRYRAVARVTGRTRTVLRLPALDADTLELRVASSFLPSLRVRRVIVTGPRQGPNAER